MTRLGWGILIAIVLVAGAFATMLSFGPVGTSTPGVPVETPPARSGDVVERPGMLPIPVAGVRAEDLADTWDQPRAGGERAHRAIDIMAPRGAIVRAAAPGRVEKLFLSGDGGNTVYVRSPGGRLVYYYAHLDAYRPGLAEGQQVRAGDVLATVGSTGNADPAAPHLHFAVKRMEPGESWHEGQPVNPYPLLVGSAPHR